MARPPMSPTRSGGGFPTSAVKPIAAPRGGGKAPPLPSTDPLPIRRSRPAGAGAPASPSVSPTGALKRGGRVKG